MHLGSKSKECLKAHIIVARAEGEGDKYRRAIRRKANLEEPDDEKLIYPEKGQKCAHTMAFFGRNWLFFIRVKKLAFLRTARRYAI